MNFRKKYQKDNKIRLTKTGLFMLPTLGFPLEVYSGILINVFTTNNIDKPEILVIFDNSIGDHLLPLLIKKLQTHENFIEKIKDDDDKEIAMKFNIPEDYKEDYYKMMSGDYSKFSVKLKNLLFSPGFYKKGIAKNKLTDYGLPAYSLFEAIYPTQNKIEELEENLGCKLEKPEILDKPQIEHELYKTIKQLKKIYEKINEIEVKKAVGRVKGKKQLPQRRQNPITDR